ncbi:GMC family oxidoreductase N-terminal domain-containing protein [Streptomyces cyaneofuscatus]
MFKTPYDWDLHTVPQPGLGGRELYWPRGHGLGGSSSINAVMWVRGHTHAPTVALAERAAELIRADARVGAPRQPTAPVP